ncbi:peptidylprolyl isomerase [Massilia sp. KIM]|uniref:FKBP-type peptidyl-prolyl cis-trans isomerase n=1 Tax=Massilia sp. KIM TaxID=1955422 RepID=UPI0009901078|nr:FKBP-type peptidyl-prolyl cis-trans isomerase [Massilia sp. KIM]OON63113.1 peptidylprolyl isomerase [Massilia sp. KIM]
MKRLLSYCVLGLALSSTLAACKREAAAPASQAPAAAFQKIDTVTGAGKEAVAGSTAVVHYTGWLFDPSAPSQHGAQFDSSKGGSPFSFQVGGGQVIKGWDEGVQGMKVGGKRTLILPPDMGYGASGAGPIPPNANLIFEVELLEVR